MMIASLLLIIAIWFNREDARMILLTCVVGLSYFLPVQLILDRDTWYTACIVSEITVLMFSINLRTAASVVLSPIIMMLCLGHIIEWMTQGRSTGTVYYTVTNYFEYLEFVVLIIFSKPIVGRILERIKLCWK